MISTRSVGLLIDTVVCLSLAKWETVSGRFGGYFSQSEILSLKKAVWRLWLVSKSRTKSSAEGCEQLLRRAASVARPPSSPSQARSSNSDLNSQNGGLVKDLPEGMSDEFAPRRHSQAGLDSHVPPLDIPGFAQTLAECGREWRVGRGRPAVKE